MSRYIHAGVFNRLWLNVGWGKAQGRYFSIGLQHRIAFPPAEQQTCHHTLLIRRNYIGIQRSVI